MAAPFKKTFVKSFPKFGEKTTTDTIYWKNLEVPVTKKEYGAISSIDFSPVSPHHLAVTNSTRVQIYCSTSLQIEKTISRFKEVTYSGSFRDDGRLLVAGGDEGVLRLFDVAGKTLLRMFKGHTGSVHVSRFLASHTQILSGSDDNRVCVWDIPSEKELVVYNEHKDYVRAGVGSRASKDIFLSGSYDHTVKLYDQRMAESVLTVDHGAPVEAVQMFPSGGIFVSAGGNTVKVWDALAGGKLLTSLCHHHKTVTCLGFCSGYQRLLSGGLDRWNVSSGTLYFRDQHSPRSACAYSRTLIRGYAVRDAVSDFAEIHVKIYDVTSYQVVHTLDYPGAILSLGVSPDDSLIAVGTAEGLLSLQKRKPSEEAPVKRKKPVSYKYGLRGKTYLPNRDDHVVEHRRREQLAKYDKYFKQFEHSRALDAALDARIWRRNPEVTVSVMQELIRRDGIKAAIAGREGNSLTVLLLFIQKNISNPRYMSTLTDVAHLVIDWYSQQPGQSSQADNALSRLKQTVDQETTFMKQLYEVMGTMDTLFAASQQAQSTNQSTENQLHHIKPSVSALAS